MNTINIVTERRSSCGGFGVLYCSHPTDPTPSQLLYQSLLLLQASYKKYQFLLHESMQILNTYPLVLIFLKLTYEEMLRIL